MSASIVLIAHNIRSCHNVGSLLRTSEGLGVDNLYLTGYTPYPAYPEDSRLPHLSAKIDRQIHKTALGAEKLQRWQHQTAVQPVIQQLKRAGYRIVALEQAQNAISLPDFQAPKKIALLVGEEVHGIDQTLLSLADSCVEIPMLGSKESFNVVQAAAMALYHFRFIK